MQKWGIIFYRKNGFIPDTIERVTNHEFSHVGIIFPDRIHVADINYNQDFMIRHLRVPSDRYEVVFFTLSDIYSYHAESFIRHKLGAKYDFREILRFFIPGIRDNKRRDICSEVVRDFLDCVGFDVPWSADEPVTPGQIFDLLTLQKG